MDMASSLFAAKSPGDQEAHGACHKQRLSGVTLHDAYQIRDHLLRVVGLNVGRRRVDFVGRRFRNAHETLARGETLRLVAYGASGAMQLIGNRLPRGIHPIGGLTGKLAGLLL